MRLWICAVFLTLPCFAQSTGDLVADPNLSSRCRELVKERNDKVATRQRLTGLVERNQNLLKKTSAERTLMRKRLEANEITLRNELYLATLKVQSMEESIIRAGCPGINL